MSVEEVEVFELLTAAGSGSKDFELTDKLLGEHQLTPSHNVEVIAREFIGVQGTRPVMSAFELIEASNKKKGESLAIEMVKLNLLKPN